jgi:multiple sugar transport system permease protein
VAARKGDLSERALGILLLTPAALLMALIVVYPIGRLVWTSLTDLSLSAGSGPPDFVGLENFVFIYQDPQFWNALWVTAIYVVVTVPGALIMGMALALMANLPFRRRWPVRLALLLPWALPLVFAGLIFRWFFDTQYGVVNDMVDRLGGRPLLWLSTPGLALASSCLAIVWKSSSFVALLLLAALQTIPRELHEQARVDGASAWQAYWRVTLPLLMPAVMVALIFRTITAVQTFEIPYAMTGGGPGETTQTLALLIRKTTLDYLDFGYGSALAVVMFVISMAVTSVYLKRVFGEPA